jgi:TonB family protein
MKLALGFFAVFLLNILSAFSQDGREIKVYTPDSVLHINRMPLYPGGVEAFYKDINANFVLPKKVRKDKIHGKVILEFTVDTLGNIVEPVVASGLRDDVDIAALEMLKKLKKFSPATMDEKKVSMRLSLPIKI